MQPEPPAELVEIAARFILGPREPVPPSAKYTLAELQQVYWDQSSGQERKEALWATRAVLAAVTPQIEARVTGEIVAWLRNGEHEEYSHTGAVLGRHIERGDHRRNTGGSDDV